MMVQQVQQELKVFKAQQAMMEQQEQLALKAFKVP
jgi:hypothetical protein